MTWKVYHAETEPDTRLDLPEELSPELISYKEWEKSVKNLRYRSITTDEVRNICNEIFPEDSESKTMVAYGNGDIHNFTYGLASQAFEKHGDGGYIHVDKHPDHKLNEDTAIEIDMNPNIACGRFVERLVEDNDAESLLIGSYSDRFPFVTFYKNPPEFEAPSETSPPFSKESKTFKKEDKMWKYFLEEEGEMLEALPEDVYLSIDLDFLHPDEINIGFFGEGIARTEELMDIIDTIRDSKNIIGADVLGFPGSEDDREVEKASSLYGAIVEKIIQGTDKFEKKYYELRDRA